MDSTVSLHDVLLLNARSIVNKFSELDTILQMFNPKILAITETWLNKDIPLNVPNHIVFRCDRNSDTSGGGVLLSLDANLAPKLVGCVKCLQ